MSGSPAKRIVDPKNMASQKRILNISNGCSYKRGSIERAIEACSVSWVEYGVSVRSLNVAEAIDARNDQARRREALPFAEIPGIKFVPPVSGVAATGREGSLLWAAHDWIMKVA